MGGFGGILADVGESVAKKLADVKSPSLLGRFARRIGAQSAEGVLGDVEHAFAPLSLMTGKDGAAHLEIYNNHFLPELDKQMSIQNQKFNAGAKFSGQTGKAITPMEIKSTAMENAKNNVLGTKRENLARLMQNTLKTQGPAKVTQLTDAWGILLHEKPYEVPNTGQSKSQTSSLLAADPRLKNMGIKFNPSPYRTTNATEQALSKYTTGALAPTIAAWHAPQAILNSVTFNAHLSSVVKALGDVFGPKTFENTKAQLIAQNALGFHLMDEQMMTYNFHNRLITALPDNSISKFIHANYLTPFMPIVRKLGMVYSAMVGKYEAEYSAQQILKGGLSQKWGANKLADLGINWKDVLENGGLTPDHTRTAMFRMTQDNLHLESTGSRSRWVTTTPYGRTLTMFHQYPIMEGNLLVRRLKDALMLRQDPMQSAQMLVGLGLLFPTAGFFINNVLKGITGREDHPIDAFTTEEKNWITGQDFGDGLLILGRMAMGGVLFDYANAAAKNKLAEYFIGPVANSALELGEDAVKANPLNTGGNEHKADQFKRDLLRDTPSYGYGARLAHELYPTQAQRNAVKPMTSRRIAAQRAATKRKQTYHP
jgi:hypothetical protein